MVASPDKPIAVETDVVGDYVKAKGGDRPIRKVLIANNGMAATKSILSMRQWAYMELGDEKAIKFVAMATPEDLNANAEFIRLGEMPVPRERTLAFPQRGGLALSSPLCCLLSHQDTPPCRRASLLLRKGLDLASGLFLPVSASHLPRRRRESMRDVSVCRQSILH